LVDSGKRLQHDRQAGHRKNISFPFVLSPASVPLFSHKYTLRKTGIILLKSILRNFKISPKNKNRYQVISDPNNGFAI